MVIFGAREVRVEERIKGRQENVFTAPMSTWVPDSSRSRIPCQPRLGLPTNQLSTRVPDRTKDTAADFRRKREGKSLGLLGPLEFFRG